MIYKKKIKIIVLFLFLILIITAGFIRFFLSTPDTEKVLQKLFFNDNYRVVYFGDSVLNADHKTKKNKSSLVKIFEDTTKIKTLEISGTAYTPYIYQKYFETIKKYNNKIKLIIIPLNLRAFSSAWHRVPEYQFERECSFLSIVNLKPDLHCIKEHAKNLLFKNRKSEQRKTFLRETVNANGFLDTTKRSFFTNITKDCIFKNVEKELKFVCKSKEYTDQFKEYMQHGVTKKVAINAMRYNYHYSETIDDNNISLKSIKAIVSLAKKTNTKVLFYVTPHNIEEILKTAGNGLTNIMLENLIKINEVLKGGNIYKLNLIDLLSYSHFEKSCNCEHIDKEGKEKISKKINNFIITKIGSI